MFDAYTQFAIQCDGPLLVHQRIASHFADRSQLTPYSLDSTGDPRVENMRIADGRYHFDLVADGRKVEGLQLGMPGRHNVENAIAAGTVALRLGVSPSDLVKGMQTFRGVSRRFDVRVNGDRVVYIDDYAHHPAELEACIGSVRELFPGRRITGIFQPHLFSRTRDQAAGFAKSLALLDSLLLMEIYPAREEPIEGITSAWLLEQVPMEDKRLTTANDLVADLRSAELDVVITMGAGDIDRSVSGVQRLMNEIQSTWNA